MASSPYELDGHRPLPEPEYDPYNTSFTTKRINKTTFLIVEDDEFEEHPFIYVKVHPKLPIIILSDTGCAQPKRKIGKDENYINLREYLEYRSIEANGNGPLNPGGVRQYVVICTHCHYDHVGGIMQFIQGGTTDIVASAAGRDFIESDLPSHSEFKHIGRPTPYYQVTHWAQAFERLTYPLTSLAYPHRKAGEQDLGITIIQTAGHTPDELAWYDHDERHLYVGDSFYEEGKDGMPIIWSGYGNWIEWTFNMQKLLSFVRSQNGEEARSVRGWELVPKRVKISCAHQTTSVDGEQIIEDLKKRFSRILTGQTPVIKSSSIMGETVDTWRDDGKDVKFSFQAPRRLCEDARRFFNLWPAEEDFVEV